MDGIKFYRNFSIVNYEQEVGALLAPMDMIENYYSRDP